MMMAMASSLWMTNIRTGLAQRLMTDYEAVQNLIVSERLYRVSHRNAELAECYAEDAQIHTSCCFNYTERDP